MKKRTKINIGVLVSICILSTGIILSSAKVTYHSERIATFLTHVNGEKVGPPIILYDSKNPWSVRLQLVDYYFDGEALRWNITDNSILFTDGIYVLGFHLFEDSRISKISGFRLDMPIWYDIEYKEISNVFGTSYHVIDAKVVEPSIIYTLGEGAKIEWKIL